MQRWNDEQRKQWQETVKDSRYELSCNCPHEVDEQIVSADEHIKFLEYRLAIYATLVDRYICRAMSKEDVKNYIDENLAEETLQGEMK